MEMILLSDLPREESFYKTSRAVFFVPSSCNVTLQMSIIGALILCLLFVCWDTEWKHELVT